MHWHHGVAFGDDNEGCNGVWIGSPAVRNVAEGGGAGTEPNDPTINRLEYEKKTINNARWPGAGVGVALFLSCYCGAL